MLEKTFPDIIENLPLFQGVPAAERSRLLSAGRLRRLSRGEYLFRHGDPIKSFYIVCSGSMRLVRETPDGKEVTTDITCEGSTIGKIDVLRDFSAHTVSACAIGDAAVLEFPAGWLREVAANPTVALNLLAAMSQYVHMIELESEQKSTMSVPQRVGCFLQRLCVIHQLDPRGFELPYSKALIASRLGIEPETLSRGLAALKEHGIKVENSTISFGDMQAAHDFVCVHCSIVGECATHKKISSC